MAKGRPPPDTPSPEEKLLTGRSRPSCGQDRHYRALFSSPHPPRLPHQHSALRKATRSMATLHSRSVMAVPSRSDSLGNPEGNAKPPGFPLECLTRGLRKISDFVSAKQLNRCGNLRKIIQEITFPSSEDERRRKNFRTKHQCAFVLQVFPTRLKLDLILPIKLFSNPASKHLKQPSEK